MGHLRSYQTSEHEKTDAMNLFDNIREMKPRETSSIHRAADESTRGDYEDAKIMDKEIRCEAVMTAWRRPQELSTWSEDCARIKLGMGERNVTRGTQASQERRSRNTTYRNLAMTKGTPRERLRNEPITSVKKTCRHTKEYPEIHLDQKNGKAERPW